MVLYVSDDPQYPFEMSEANQLTDFVSNIDSDVDVMWGLYKIPGLEGKVKITILASGFDVTVDENTPRPIVDTKKIESEKAVNQLIEKEYGKEAADALNRRASGVRTKVLNPEDLDNDEAIAEAETVAFKRNRPNVSSSFNSTLRNNINAANNGRAASTQKGTEIDFGDLN
jgi:cell division protein FtsZ